jgi:K+-transporting ATPase ATPase A chain
MAAVQPAAIPGDAAGARIQHGGVVHDQHELAGLQRRVGHELPDPDGRSRFHNAVSAATRVALAIAFIRGVARRERETIGNFWVDLVRASLWILLPLCLAAALVLVSQGVVQNLRPYDVVSPLDGGTQTIAEGPVASQEAIKELGTNGGGFFNANSAHPFENPTPLSNFFEMLCIFALSAGLTVTPWRSTS